MSAKMGIFAAELWFFLADRTMEYISVKQFAEKFNVSERTARNYCASGKIDGARLVGGLRAASITVSRSISPITPTTLRVAA